MNEQIVIIGDGKERSDRDEIHDVLKSVNILDLLLIKDAIERKPNGSSIMSAVNENGAVHQPVDNVQPWLLVVEGRK